MGDEALTPSATVRVTAWLLRKKIASSTAGDGMATERLSLGRRDGSTWWSMVGSSDDMAVEAGDGGKQMRAWSDSPGGGGPSRLLAELEAPGRRWRYGQSLAMCPALLQRMQCTWSRQPAIRCLLLKQRKQRPRKRAVKEEGGELPLKARERSVRFSPGAAARPAG
ncbi:hypothetical protein ZWY2020_024142 [Hordeum vulgare]|nr:hypothetical protein ZWY2020_024142 [Hordeum vulgare]